MKKPPRRSDRPVDVDYVEVNEARRRFPSARWLRISIFSLAVLGGLAASWLLAVHVVQPMRHEAQLDKALAALISADATSERHVARAKERRTKEAQLLDAFDLLSEPTNGLDDTVRLAGARAALALAQREGSVEALILSGKAHRDGTFGVKDPTKALRDFETAVRMNDPALRVGDPDAFYLQAQMAWHGLGMPVDRDGADKWARHAAETMNGSWRLSRVLDDGMRGSPPFAARLTVDQLSGLLDRAMRSGLVDAYYRAFGICHREANERKEAGVLTEAEALEHATRCYSKWVSRAAEAGHVPAFGAHGQHLLSLDGDVANALRWFEKGRHQLSPDEQVTYGLAASIFGSSLSDRQQGFSRLLGGIQRGKEEQQRFGFGDVAWNMQLSIPYFTLLGYIQGVVAEPVSSERIAITFRALADHFGYTRPAVQALQDWEGRQASARLFHTAYVREAAAILRGVAPSVTAAQPAPRGSLHSPQSTVTPDREQQDRTGYIAGAPRLAADGLSRFTVDNTNGAGDAIARLYLDGRRPAVRSFFVKQGEKFTADKLTPGTYVMRYRYMGSDDTYEADRAFALRQEETDTGTRYSNVTVTLFRVRDGNMQTKKVPPESF